MAYQNVYNVNGVLDWVFNENENTIKTVAKSDSVTTENELIFLLTAGFTSDIVVTENGITGSFYTAEDQFNNPIGNNVTALASQIKIPAQDSELRDLEITCVSALSSIRNRTGVTDLECVAYVEGVTVFVEILIGINEDDTEEYQIALWRK